MSADLFNASELPFNLAGEKIDNALTDEGEKRVRALAASEARKAQLQLLTETAGPLKKIKTITSYAGHARWLAETRDCGWIPRSFRSEIPSPYSYGPTTFVFLWKAKRVICSEVSHKRYEVYEIPPKMKVYPSDAEAMEVDFPRK